MKKPIKPSDLKDQYGPGQYPFLYCECCGSTGSAHRSDYFEIDFPDEPFMCCEKPMKVVREVTTLVEIEL